MSTVRKSSPVVVRPSASEPGMATTKGTTIKLSSFDKGLYKVSATTLLVFEHPIPNPSETIRGALSRALVHYYPFAGRIVVVVGDVGEDVYIRCSGEGVAFVAASTDLAVKEVICLDRSSPGARKLVDELAVYYDPADDMADGGGPSAPPLLLVQVTEFSCGGFVVGVTWNHGVADGAGMGQFLGAVSELATGMPSPSVAPARRDDDSVPILPPSVRQAQAHLLNMDPVNDLAVLDITVPSRSVNRIRADFSSRFNGLPPCTTFEAVAAVLWQCRTRATMRLDDDLETPIMLVFLASVRKHLGAKRGYYGNCIVEQLVVTTGRAVTAADVVDVVNMIRRAKEQIPDRLKGNAQEVIKGEQELMRDLHTYNTLTVASWRNLGLDKVDFGGGRPARVTTSAQDMPPSPPAVSFLCDGEDDGVNVLSALVMEEHAQAFHGELAKFVM